MTTTSVAIGQLAHQLELPEVWLAQIAKTLRGEPGDLWPTGAAGGGKNAAHVEGHHLRNLLIACAAAQHVPGIADVVRQYAALQMRPVKVASSEQRRLPFDVEKRGVTLASAIDTLIEALLDPRQCPQIMALGLEIEISRTTPLVRITPAALPRENEQTIFFRAAAGPETHVPGFRVLTTISVNEVLPMCARMVEDTRWHARAAKKSRAQAV